MNPSMNQRTWAAPLIPAMTPPPLLSNDAWQRGASLRIGTVFFYLKSIHLRGILALDTIVAA